MKPWPLLFVLLPVLSLAQDPFAQFEPSSESPFPISQDPEGKDYFPKGRASYYTKHLLAMKEPSLFALSGQSDTPDQFRFLYLPTFSKPIVFRTVSRDGKHFIHVVRLTGMGGYEPGEIEFQADVAIQEFEIQALGRVLQEAFEEPISEMQRAALEGLDGATWIFESLVDGKYEMQDLWSPKQYVEGDDIPRFKEFFKENGLEFPDLTHFVISGEYFLELTDMKFPERDPSFQMGLPAEE